MATGIAASTRVGIVGGGIVGASLAYAFARRGVAVTVLEEDEPLTPQAATANTFGWLSNQAFFRSKDSVPDELARAYFDLHRAGLDVWRRWDSALGNQLGVRWAGTIQWASGNNEECDRLQRELERRQSWGSPSRTIDADDLHALLPGARRQKVDFGFHTSDEGTVNPFAAVGALLSAVRGAGGVLVTGSKVKEIVATPNGGVVVRHTKGELARDLVIVACGVRTPDIVRGLGISVPLLVSTGELVHLEPLPAFLDPLVLGPSVNVVQRNDGRVVLGRHFTGQPLTDLGTLDSDGLVADAAELFAALEGARVEKVTTARRIVPADAVPIWGESASVPGAYALAMNAGITLGPVMAELIADELLSGAPSARLDRYRSTRFT